MKIKKYLILFIVIALILCAAIILFLPQLFPSHNIIEASDAASIVRITYNPYVDQGNYEAVEITEYDESEVLSCLSRYKERRTLAKAGGYRLGDVEIEIMLHTQDGLKSILLGNRNLNYSFQSSDHPKYTILDVENLRLELLKILNISRSLRLCVA